MFSLEKKSSKDLPKKFRKFGPGYQIHENLLSMEQLSLGSSERLSCFGSLSHFVPN